MTGVSPTMTRELKTINPATEEVRYYTILIEKSNSFGGSTKINIVTSGYAMYAIAIPDKISIMILNPRSFTPLIDIAPTTFASYYYVMAFSYLLLLPLYVVAHYRNILEL